MQEEIFSKILGDPEKKLFLERTGPATIADLAASVSDTGRDAVILSIKREFSSAVSGLARIFNPALSCSVYPVSEPLWKRPLLVFPETRSWNDNQGWLMRMPIYYALSLRKPVCLVASMEDVLIKTMPVDFFEKRTLELSAGSEYSPELIAEQAIEWGFTRTPMVNAPGEMARRGDILDIFVPGYAKPARLEFFGDALEEIRLFDADTQRSLQSLPELTIIPASPIPRDTAGVKDALKRITQLSGTGALSENDAYSLKRKIEELGEGVMPGAIWENAGLLEDWLVNEPVWFLPGENDCLDALRDVRLALKTDLENEENPLRQPARLVLRRNSQPAPWNGRKQVYAEPLNVGVEEKGISLQEQEYHSFQDIFPKPDEQERPWQTLIHGIREMRSKLSQVILVFSSERSRQKFVNLASQDGLSPLLRYMPSEKGVYAVISSWRKGARLDWAKIILLGEDIFYPRAEKRHRRASSVFKGLSRLDSLKEGDLLVHRDYGIGRYCGLKHLEINNVANDFLLLEYAGKDKLYLPADRLNLVQRFKGPEGFEAALDRLGSQTWILGREKARKAIEKIAADLVEMYAYRKVAKSFHYAPPDDLYREFEATFGFEETPDQARAIQDVLDDMEKDSPMDRLICGDVGFGKTEVALRAAFRAAEQGRQVALLCPTTVLAEQHYQTFRSRLSGFPVNVGLLSRFVPRARQKEVLKQCAAGQIDILIGTHRLLSSDVKLPNLGLLILDEEQRFGVRHKEKLKSLKKNVDVLTLTATPIPRTLQLSMAGIRDLSIIETAPVDRKPVFSSVLQRDDATLRKVLEKELERKGQVFWVYNRVHDLPRVVEYVSRLAPDARIGMAHGQLPENELEETMRKFWHGEIDILVCTSIVESGLDFPGANTLVVDQAQMFGLGQLYQLRGRVGRSDKQAYAYFVVPDARKLAESAEERLKVIMNMDYLGAGFQVAMEDLRLRGAGNILGEAQSGHISRVGLDMYLEMLEEAVGRLKGQLVASSNETEMNLGVPAHIPKSYIDDDRERIRYYKALTAASSSAAMEEIMLDLRDRFGPYPPELRNFFAVLNFKRHLGKIETARADIQANSLRLSWNEDQNSIDPAKLAEEIRNNERVKLVPPGSLLFAYEKDVELDAMLQDAVQFLKNVRLEKDSGNAQEGVPTKGEKIEILDQESF